MPSSVLTISILLLLVVSSMASVVIANAYTLPSSNSGGYTYCSANTDPTGCSLSASTNTTTLNVDAMTKAAALAGNASAVLEAYGLVFQSTLSIDCFTGAPMDNGARLTVLIVNGSSVATKPLLQFIIIRGALGVGSSVSIIGGTYSYIADGASFLFLNFGVALSAASYISITGVTFSHRDYSFATPVAFSVIRTSNGPLTLSGESKVLLEGNNFIVTNVSNTGAWEWYQLFAEQSPISISSNSTLSLSRNNYNVYDVVGGWTWKWFILNLDFSDVTVSSNSTFNVSKNNFILLNIRMTSSWSWYPFYVTNRDITVTGQSNLIVNSNTFNVTSVTSSNQIYWYYFFSGKSITVASNSSLSISKTSFNVVNFRAGFTWRWYHLASASSAVSINSGGVFTASDNKYWLKNVSTTGTYFWYFAYVTSKPVVISGIGSAFKLNSNVFVFADVVCGTAWTWYSGLFLSAASIVVAENAIFDNSMSSFTLTNVSSTTAFTWHGIYLFNSPAAFTSGANVYISHQTYTIVTPISIPLVWYALYIPSSTMTIVNPGTTFEVTGNRFEGAVGSPVSTSTTAYLMSFQNQIFLSDSAAWIIGYNRVNSNQAILVQFASNPTTPITIATCRNYVKGRMSNCVTNSVSGRYSCFDTVAVNITSIPCRNTSTMTISGPTATISNANLSVSVTPTIIPPTPTPSKAAFTVTTTVNLTTEEGSASNSSPTSSQGVTSGASSAPTASTSTTTTTTSTTATSPSSAPASTTTSSTTSTSGSSPSPPPPPSTTSTMTSASGPVLPTTTTPSTISSASSPPPPGSSTISTTTSSPMSGSTTTITTTGSTATTATSSAGRMSSLPIASQLSSTTSSPLPTTTATTIMPSSSSTTTTTSSPTSPASAPSNPTATATGSLTTSTTTTTPTTPSTTSTTVIPCATALASKRKAELPLFTTLSLSPEAVQSGSTTTLPTTSLLNATISLLLANNLTTGLSGIMYTVVSKSVSGNADGFASHAPHIKVTVLNTSAVQIDLSALPDYRVLEGESLDLYLPNAVVEGVECNTGTILFIGQIRVVVSVKIGTSPSAVTTTIVSGGAVAAGVAGGMAGMAAEQQGLSAVVMFNCADPKSRESFGSYRALSPFAIFESYAGVVLGNVIAVGVVALVQIIVLGVMAICRPVQRLIQHLCAARFPNFTFNVAFALHTGTAFAASQLVSLTDEFEPWEVAIGGIAFAYAVLFPVFLMLHPYLRIERAYQEYENEEWLSQRKWPAFLRFLVPRGSIYSPETRRAYGSYISSYRAPAVQIWWTSFPTWTSTLVAIGGLFHPKSIAGCQALFGCLGLVFLLLAVWIVWCRPLRSPAACYFNAAGKVLMALVLFSLVSSLRGDIAASTAVVAFGILQTIATIIRLLHAGFCMYFDFKMAKDDVGLNTVWSHIPGESKKLTHVFGVSSTSKDLQAAVSTRDVGEGGGIFNSIPDDQIDGGGGRGRGGGSRGKDAPLLMNRFGIEMLDDDEGGSGGGEMMLLPAPHNKKKHHHHQQPDPSKKQPELQQGVVGVSMEGATRSSSSMSSSDIFSSKSNSSSVTTPTSSSSPSPVALDVQPLSVNKKGTTPSLSRLSSSSSILTSPRSSGGSLNLSDDDAL